MFLFRPSEKCLDTWAEGCHIWLLFCAGSTWSLHPSHALVLLHWRHPRCFSIRKYVKVRRVKEFLKEIALKKKKKSHLLSLVFSFFYVHLLWKEARLSSVTATSLISDVLHLWWAGEMWELIEYCLPVVSMLTTSTDLYILDTERCVPLNLLARFGFYTFWSISSWRYVYAFWLEHLSWSI